MKQRKYIPLPNLPQTPEPKPTPIPERLSKPQPRNSMKPQLREPAKPSDLMKNNHQQVPSANETATSEEVNRSAHAAVNSASTFSTILSKVITFVLWISTIGSGKLKMTICALLIILKTKRFKM